MPGPAGDELGRLDDVLGLNHVRRFVHGPLDRAPIEVDPVGSMALVETFLSGQTP